MGNEFERMRDAVIAELQERRACPPLTPQTVWHPGLDERIGNLPDTGTEISAAWKAALHLWNDSLNAAHELAQNLDTPTGSVLHGIMHRREGDYSNAKYWFRLAGGHPAYSRLQTDAADLLRTNMSKVDSPIRETIETIKAQAAWNPYLFVDAAAVLESASAEEGDARIVLEQLQQLELEAIIRYLSERETNSRS